MICIYSNRTIRILFKPIDLFTFSTIQDNLLLSIPVILLGTEKCMYTEDKTCRGVYL